MYNDMADYVEEHITFGAVEYEKIAAVNVVLANVRNPSYEPQHADVQVLWKVMQKAQRTQMGPRLTKEDRICIYTHWITLDALHTRLDEAMLMKQNQERQAKAEAEQKQKEDADKKVGDAPADAENDNFTQIPDEQINYSAPEEPRGTNDISGEIKEEEFDETKSTNSSTKSEKSSDGEVATKCPILKEVITIFSKFDLHTDRLMRPKLSLNMFANMITDVMQAISILKDEKDIKENHVDGNRSESSVDVLQMSSEEHGGSTTASSEHSQNSVDADEHSIHSDHSQHSSDIDAEFMKHDEGVDDQDTDLILSEQGYNDELQRIENETMPTHSYFSDDSQ